MTATSNSSAAVSADTRRTNVRYWILALIFIVTTINYADRATLSITDRKSVV